MIDAAITGLLIAVAAHASAQQPAKTAIDILVVDHAEHPTED